MPQDVPPLPEFTTWPTFPFEGDIRVKRLDPPAAVEPARQGDDPDTCQACAAPDEEYIWVANRWRVRGLERPTGLPMVLILESRTHLDLGDLPNLLAAELGVMTVRLERAIRSLDGVARVHVNRWGDGSAHLHVWFLARPYGRLQLRGTFLSLWDDLLPPVPEERWRANLGLVAAWLADFGGRAIAEPPRIEWQSPSRLSDELPLVEPLDPRLTAGGDYVSDAELAGTEPASDGTDIYSVSSASAADYTYEPWTDLSGYESTTDTASSSTELPWLPTADAIWTAEATSSPDAAPDAQPDLDAHAATDAQATLDTLVTPAAEATRATEDAPGMSPDVTPVSAHPADAEAAAPAPAAASEADGAPTDEPKPKPKPKAKPRTRSTAKPKTAAAAAPAAAAEEPTVMVAAGDERTVRVPVLPPDPKDPEEAWTESV